MKNKDKKTYSTKLTLKQKNELQKLTDEIIMEADMLVTDYKKNPYNSESGSLYVVHENSPFLKENKKEKDAD